MVEPVSISKWMKGYDKKPADILEKKKDKMLALMFMNGASYKVFRFILKKLCTSF